MFTTTRIKHVLLYMVIIFLSACSDDDTNWNEKPQHSDSFEYQWLDIIDSVLADPLWLNDYAYDTSTSLMLPMHYAFKNPDRFERDPRIVFDIFFSNLSDSFDPNNIQSFTAKSQFLYFITQYVKLKSQQGSIENLIPLVNVLEEELVDVWLYRPAVHWDKSLNFVGLKQRLNWNLTDPDTQYSYYRAVIDQDWFTIAALSDLAVIQHHLGHKTLFNEGDLKTIIQGVLNRFGEFHGENWYFQKGVWWDHPDYIYVGNQEIEPEITSDPIPDIAIDSSHSHRMPLWLNSFADFDEAGADYYKNIIVEMRNTFEKNVFVPVNESGYQYLLMNNYMDGNNGLYRFNYVTQGEGNGFQAYQLSGSLFVGYYSFLDSAVYRDSLRNMSTSFPLKQHVLDYYVGPNTSRNKHPKFVWPAYFQNGFAELFSKIAGCYGSTIEICDP